MTSIELLDGVRVLDASDGAGRITGRFLADLGATVFCAPPCPTIGCGDFGSSEAIWHRFWDYRKQHVPLDDIAKVDIVLASADTPLELRDRYPTAAWVMITPFGRTGPRAGWRGSELTCIAASGNLYPTGYPDRPPLACSRPTALAHGAADAAIGALFALAAGDSPEVDVSVQEATVGANLGAHTTLYRHRLRGERVGPFAAGTREVWRCSDGHVSFAIRGGPARAATWVALRELLDEHGIDTSALPQGDARSFDSALAGTETIDAISQVVGPFFASRTKSELHRHARERGIMLAPILGPAEIVAHQQLHHREFFDVDAPTAGFAGSPFRVTAAPGPASTPAPRRPRDRNRIWDGVRIVEFASAFAGPLASRYFVEHGATCLHVESARQPDAARTSSSVPVDPEHPFLERSPLFAAINVNKMSVLIDLKTDEGRELARRLVVEWADVLVENYSPHVLEKAGLGYDTLAAQRPDLVYASSTMWGHDGPHASEKGFGGIGQAQSGHVFLTGDADRDPVFPFGLITDSLTPKLTAAAIAAALERRKRTGVGCHIDVSQIQAAAYTIAPWLVEHVVTGTEPGRCGNDFAPQALCHGVFPCAGDDRWLALAIWTDAEASAAATVLRLRDGAALKDIDAVSAATIQRDAGDLAIALQAAGVDAYAVLDLVEVCSDPQLSERGHFVDAVHPVHGTLLLERGASRIAGYPGVALRAGSLFGHDTRSALRLALNLDDAELDELERTGALR